MDKFSVFSKIEKLDSLKQEKIFLTQKYRDFYFDTNFLKESIENLDLNEKEKVGLFELFKIIKNDERTLNLVLTEKTLNEKTFEYKSRQESFDFFKKKGLTNEIKKISKQILLENKLVIKDILRYLELESQIKLKENEDISINGEVSKVRDVSEYYSKQVTKAMLHKKREDKSEDKEKLNFDTTDVEFENDFLEKFGLNLSNIEKNDKDISNLAWKYQFFKTIQKSVESGYVLTHRELSLVNDITDDLKNGKVVLLTGDTGSGKTEVARFLCKEYLKSDYVFVSGSREAEPSDFTIEKTVTSKSPLTTETDIIDKEINDNNEFLEIEVDKIFNEINKLDSFKKLVIEKAIENGKDENEVKKLEKDLEEMDLTKKSLVTEYHLMGIYKAMKLGIPCIIDEVNLIRPEVFMALNDLLTRKSGDKVQLPNALKDIEVKKGFCIILTGNDPDQNSKTKKYTSGRYNFDEATYNRLRVYAKNYLNQIIQTHDEYKIQELDKTYEYLDENELYGVILMMMFKNESEITSTGKYGFEVMKRNFEGNNIGKSEFFENIKNFSKAISTVQKAFAGETIILDGKYSAISLSEDIKRKVFSMRNLIDVLESYKKDIKPLDYHIYHEFIKHTTNKREIYALLIAFSQFGFFKDLVTDNDEATIKNIEKKMGRMKETESDIKLSDIENKFIVTKQDLYPEYFGTLNLDDEFFEKKQEEIKEFEKTNEDDNNLESKKEIEITSEDLLETLEETKEILLDNTESIDLLQFFELNSLLDMLSQEIKEGNIEKKSFSSINSILIKLNQVILSNADDEYITEEVQQIIQNLNVFKK